MALTFHDGSNDVYKNYVRNRRWLDNGLLGLDPQRDNDRTLAASNTEDIVRGLLGHGSVRAHRLEGYVSPLSAYFDDDRAGIIVIKGLHQPYYRGNWKPHLSVGLDAVIFHLYFTWTWANEFIFDSSTKGESVAAQTHDGFSVVGGGNMGRGGGRRGHR